MGSVEKFKALRLREYGAAPRGEPCEMQGQSGSYDAGTVLRQRDAYNVVGPFRWLSWFRTNVASCRRTGHQLVVGGKDGLAFELGMHPLSLLPVNTSVATSVTCIPFGNVLVFGKPSCISSIF